MVFTDCSPLLYDSGPPDKGMALPLVGWALLHQLAIRGKSPPTTPQVNLREAILLLTLSPSLCQGDQNYSAS